MQEENKTVDIDTSGPAVDVELPEEKKQEVVEQPEENTFALPSFECLDVSMEGGTMWINLNRPHQKNALNLKMLKELELIIQVVRPQLKPFAHHLDWINLGGGHHLTRPGYQLDSLCDLLVEIQQEFQSRVYLEPGEAVAFEAGILVGEVLDVMETDRLHAILDVSATCHMPDVIEAPYRPALLGESSSIEGITVRLGGPSCLAGDQIGDYVLSHRPSVGERLAFLDQAHYSMVKTNTFNGVPLPSIALWDSHTDDLKIIRSFDWTEFERRLS